MDGWAIAAAPLAHGGLGSLATGFPGAQPLQIRIDAALAIVGDGSEARAVRDKPESAAPIGAMRARRP
jgi:hypothetical protein